MSSCGCQEFSLDLLEEYMLLTAEISPSLYYLVFVVPPTKVHRINKSIDFLLFFLMKVLLEHISLVLYTGSFLVTAT